MVRKREREKVTGQKKKKIEEKVMYGPVLFPYRFDFSRLSVSTLPLVTSLVYPVNTVPKWHISRGPYIILEEIHGVLRR